MNHSQSATVNGISLHYEKVGKGNHPVLLIPGALGNVAAAKKSNFHSTRNVASKRITSSGIH